MTCAKRRVVCVIHPLLGPAARGENWCANPQPVCPREPDDDYSKCKTICQQRGHAEEEALLRVAELGLSAHSAHAEIFGHYWMCQNCGAALWNAGVRTIEIVNGPIPEWAA